MYELGLMSKSACVIYPTAFQNVTFLLITLYKPSVWSLCLTFN